MKHTIPIDAAKSIQLEDDGDQAHVRLLTFGIPAMHQVVEPELLMALAEAASTVAKAVDASRQGRG